MKFSLKKQMMNGYKFSLRPNKLFQRKKRNNQKNNKKEKKKVYLVKKNTKN